MARTSRPHPQIETCRARFALAADGSLPPNCFRGMASVFGTLVDTWVPTRILPGAFTKTLQENASRIKVLWQHDEAWPIGLPLMLEERVDGLYVEAEISADVPEGQRCLALMRPLPGAGRPVIDELSIGFDPIKWEMVDLGQDNIERHIKELRLWEFSPVTFAANRDAKVTAVHSLRQALGCTEALAADLLPALERAAQAADPTAALLVVVQHVGDRLKAGPRRETSRAALVDAIASLTALLPSAEPPAVPALTVRVEHALRDLDLASLAARVAA